MDREELVKEIMDELGLKGESKRRLLMKIAEECEDEKKKILYKAKRVFITERYRMKHGNKKGVKNCY
ncbi:MAG: hypothetical protein ACXQS7_05085 [Candidatus Syntropharchaeia archaeon]